MIVRRGFQSAARHHVNEFAVRKNAIRGDAADTQENTRKAPTVRRFAVLGRRNTVNFAGWPPFYRAMPFNAGRMRRRRTSQIDVTTPWCAWAGKV